jgi:protein-S-isoprenylcysteine O-methyltransferase Ste14
MTTAIKELGKMLWHSLEFLPSALSAPPMSEPPRLRVGFGGDIPVFPPLALVLCMASGFGAWAATGTRGSILLRDIMPDRYNTGIRVIVPVLLAMFGAHVKQQCVIALDKAGTKSDFQPVSSVANTGPYKRCRNPMYWAVLTIPYAIGFATDTMWVMVGSSVTMWLYLDKVVVPAEEAFLQKQIGDAYKKYCTEAKRWGLF